MSSTTTSCLIVSTILLTQGLTPITCAKAEDRTQVRVELTVDFGPDRGQNFGSLFEITDAKGNVVAGAGFLGAYNTYIRSERTTLQCFVRSTNQSQEWSIEKLPPVHTTATGLYPFTLGGQLYVFDTADSEPHIHRWNDSSETWEVAEDANPRTHFVAGKPIVQRDTQLEYDGKVLIDTANTGERIGEHYYAQGKLFVRQFGGQGSSKNRLVVYPWVPEQTPADRLTPNENWGFELSNPREFFYTFGQWENDLIAITNTGTVLRFTDGQWEVMRESLAAVSYQIYCGINFQDKLLLGHYPHGCMYQYTGRDVTSLGGWPPVMQGVAKTARELQSAAIYGGDLYVGVWPWAEVWKYCSNQAQWNFVQRMFTHPELTETYQHPYEAETSKVEKEANLWGQRVTGLIPLGKSLIITVSSKRGFPWEPRFDFLSAEQRADYSAVYRATLPGNLAVTTQWKSEPTTFTFLLSNGYLSICQDGKELGKVAIDDKIQQSFSPANIQWGKGVFGPSTAKFVQQNWTVTPVSLPPTMRSAYLHPERVYNHPDDTKATKETSKQILNVAESLQLNALFPYFTGGLGQPYYPSDIVPGNPFGAHDPLSDLISEAKSRGIKVYPVVCVAICGNESPTGILLEHPEWALRHPDGQPLGYLSPAHPEARQWIVHVIEEILKRYNPDGILLDYIRFHNRPLRLDAAAEELFERSLPPDCTPQERKARMQAFKEEAVTAWVHEIAQAVQRIKPGAALGAYCWGPHTTQNHLTAQVWPRWVAAGYLDFVNISGYYHRESYQDRYLTVFEQKIAEAVAINRALPRQAQLSFALGIVTSHGRVHSTEDIITYLRHAKKLGMPGFAYYLLNDIDPYLEELKNIPDS